MGLILKLAAVVLTAAVLTACGYEQTESCKLLTIRLYCSNYEYDESSRTVEKDYMIEYSYEKEDGKIETERCSPEWIHVGKETKVLLEEGRMGPQLYLSVEDYNKLYSLGTTQSKEDK